MTNQSCQKRCLSWDRVSRAEVEHPTEGQIRLIAKPGEFPRTQSTVRSAAPELDQHTEEVLLELGRIWDEFARLKDQRVKA